MCRLNIFIIIYYRSSLSFCRKGLPTDFNNDWDTPHIRNRQSQIKKGRLILPAIDY